MRYINVEIYDYFYVFRHIQYETSKLYTQSASNFPVSMKNLKIFYIWYALIRGCDSLESELKMVIE